jgi:microcin C transport system permease protein
MSRLSPINQARWARFRSNRRGYWSLWIFLVLFVLSLGANLIANDRPLLVRYEGRLYLPFIIDYSETTFGGELNTATDYQDPFVKKQINSHGWAVWPPIRFSYDTINFATEVPFPSRLHATICWAPTATAATYWPACCMAFVFRCCSGWR